MKTKPNFNITKIQAGKLAAKFGSKKWTRELAKENRASLTKNLTSNQAVANLVKVAKFEKPDFGSDGHKTKLPDVLVCTK